MEKNITSKEYDLKDAIAAAKAEAEAEIKGACK